MPRAAILALSALVLVACARGSSSPAAARADESASRPSASAPPGEGPAPARASSSLTPEMVEAMKPALRAKLKAELHLSDAEADKMIADLYAPPRPGAAAPSPRSSR